MTEAPATIAEAHEALGELGETITDVEMFVGLLTNLDDTGGVEVQHIMRAADKMTDLLKEVERVRVLAWQATAERADG
jgi:archaellum component FlaC